MISTNHIQIALGASRPPLSAPVSICVRVLDKGRQAELQAKKQRQQALSSMDAQIIAMITEGMSNVQIGKALDRSKHTINKHTKLLLKKHCLKNRAEFWKLRFPELSGNSEELLRVRQGEN